MPKNFNLTSLIKCYVPLVFTAVYTAPCIPSYTSFHSDYILPHNITTSHSQTSLPLWLDSSLVCVRGRSVHWKIFSSILASLYLMTGALLSWVTTMDTANTLLRTTTPDCKIFNRLACFVYLGFFENKLNNCLERNLADIPFKCIGVWTT